MPDSDKTPRVSVIIPCYGGERFVVAAVESVLAQTEPRVEVIVVDDHSPDGSRAVLEPLLSNPRVRLLTHNENRGIAAARNTGLRTSDAEFIGFLDQDDLWLPGKIELPLGVFADGPARPRSQQCEPAVSRRTLRLTLIPSRLCASLTNQTVFSHGDTEGAYA
ncbi:glycosyltransferase [bacterium]|nr:glycosyltransferase [bacterium]